MKEDFLDKPNLIEEAQKINQIAMNYLRTTTGPASWTNPRTNVTYSVPSGGELALAKKIRDDNETVFGVLDLDESIGNLETEIGDIDTRVETLETEMDGKQNGSTGTTAERPTLTSNDAGYIYFDTDLGYPIWWDGTQWVDSSGETIT